MPGRFVRTAAVALATTVAGTVMPSARGSAIASAPSTGIQAASSPFPAGPMVFRVFTAQFRSNGTFVIEGTIEGMGSLNVGGKWKGQPDAR